MGNAAIANHTFHNAITSASTGTDYSIHSAEDFMNLEFVISTGGTFSASVKAQVLDTNVWHDYEVFDHPTRTATATVTDATKLYELNLRGISKVRIDVTAVTGTLSVYGKAVG